MAKSKSGGTRAYIRGRVGSDVYSVGKTAKGKKQQVVRSLAESVANPQTEAQMFGRMIMSTVMQNVAALRPLIDHSFDNVTGKQPNISEFISRNYGLIKADAIAHPSDGIKFGLNKYQEKGAKGGALVIAAGQVPNSSAVTFSVANGQLIVTLTAGSETFGDLKAALGLEGGDYITMVEIMADGSLNYCRMYLSATAADSTELTTAALATLITVESEGEFDLTYNDANHQLLVTNIESANAIGYILSKKTASGWEHNNAVMTPHTAIEWSSDVALPTYPTGAEQFLNGGDIF